MLVFFGGEGNGIEALKMTQARILLQLQPINLAKLSSTQLFLL